MEKQHILIVYGLVIAISYIGLVKQQLFCSSDQSHLTTTMEPLVEMLTKMLRTRYTIYLDAVRGQREFFRDGIELQKRLAHFPSRQCSTRTAICAILKNEAPFVQEWLVYHILLGVTHF